MPPFSLSFRVVLSLCDEIKNQHQSLVCVYGNLPLQHVVLILVYLIWVWEVTLHIIEVNIIENNSVSENEFHLFVLFYGKNNPLVWYCEEAENCTS